MDIRLYSIIYEAVEDVRSALEGLLQPEEKEVLLGEAAVRQIFKVPRVGLSYEEMRAQVFPETLPPPREV